MTRMDGTRTTIATATIRLTTTRIWSSVWQTQEDKMQQGITACAQATIDGGMVQSKDKESCTNGSGAAWFFPYYLRSSQKLLMHLQDYNSVEAMAFNG